jgi:signal transduction histidine kinase
MSSFRILIVEDDSVSAVLLQRSLEKNNHVVVGQADSGEEALEILSQNQVDIVMMDINLTGEMDGIKTTELINEKFDVPVVYMSSSLYSDTLSKVVGTHPSGYLIKPFNMQELTVVIELAVCKHNKEKELQKLNNGLEEKVKTRTEELYQANRELIKSLQKEREINELKSRIVLNLSHGFKTPLTSILSSAQLLQIYTENDFSSKQKIIRHVAKIENSVRTLDNLITSVLFFGRADENKLEFRPKKTQTNLFISDLLTTVNSGIENKVRITLVQNELPMTIRTDKELLYQVFENLLSNAIKYSDENQEVFFGLEYSEKKLIATIKDNGIGIPKTEQSQLFNPFFRARNVGDSEGSGLGLSIVKKCVEVMNGAITFVSEEGKGTTFTVVIPVG